MKHKEFAEAYGIENQEIKEKDGADLLEKVFDRNNLNKAYKQAKANKGASGVDGMTIDKVFVWLKENGDDITLLAKELKNKIHKLQYQMGHFFDLRYDIKI